MTKNIKLQNEIFLMQINFFVMIDNINIQKD